MAEDNNSNNNYMDLYSKGLQAPYLKDETEKPFTIRVISEVYHKDEYGNVIDKEVKISGPITKEDK